MSVMCYVILLCHFCGCRLVVVVRSSELWFVKNQFHALIVKILLLIIFVIDPQLNIITTVLI